MQNVPKLAPPVTQQQSPKLPAGREVYYLQIQGESKGPFTMGQLKGMWQSGQVTADAKYRTSNEGGWLAVVDLVDKLETTLTSSTSVTSSAETSPMKVLALQNQMKSTTTAVLLAMFLPYFGAAYGSFAITLVTLVGGFLGGVFFAGITGLQDSDASRVVFLCMVLTYVASIFWSVSSVQGYNRKLLAQDGK